MGTKPQHHHRIQLPFPSRTLLSHLTHSLTHSLPTSTSNLTSALSLWIPSSAVRRRSRSRNRGGGRGRGGGGRFSGSAAMAVGVLALQGSFNEHIACLRKLGVDAVEIRKPEQLAELSGLIIPGGESTTMAKLAEKNNLFPALRKFGSSGKPIWGTCAGLIFLAAKAVGVKEGGQELLGGLDCTVHRNFFGSQINSFEMELSVPSLASDGGAQTCRAVFIRAPAIIDVGSSVEVLAECPLAPKQAVDLPEQEQRQSYCGSEAEQHASNSVPSRAHLRPAMAPILSENG
ncbi:probable pyridoxal 5'-phosphate synthase subunit PDX2 isoform X2 [Physcomitrium patens]|uniref:probable pyridoxal 5'-phosphate synthase subunit PDX2 isoform X2 n=1 Tax=Physcomitrium patens TaxID=3218 RepID=UPI000D1666C0|nr:probable pyridoxal 5'-phosphate synthase subunit PDX2 isoform X2 [Physcomitrium patens]|eukprot:XP_024403607.1 probable pyridoxal 5'-phosphate synthase subunit PDX2 isoform X2 [Physcomitrella patens]